MKKQMSYKAKRSMIILAVIVVLAIIASIGTYAFISGNDETQAMSQTNGTASDRAGQEVEQAQQGDNPSVQVQSEDNQNDNEQPSNDRNNEQIDVANTNNDNNNDNDNDNQTTTNATTTTDNGTQGTTNNQTTTTNDGANTPIQTTQTVTTTDEVETTQTLVGFRTASLNYQVPSVSAIIPTIETPDADTTAPVYNNMGIFNWTNDNDGDEDRTEDVKYATRGSHIRLFVSFPEMLAVNPKVDFYGNDGKVTTFDLQYSEGAEFYYVEFDITDEMNLPEGKINYRVYGYADAAGNVGVDLTQDDTLSNEYPYVIYDITAPGTGNQFEGFPLYVLSLTDDEYSHRQYINDGQTLRVEANFNEKLDELPVLTIGTGENIQTVTFRGGKETNGRYVYVADIRIDNSILKLNDGDRVEFKITNVSDLAGNTAEFSNEDATKYYVDGNLRYDQVTYDNTAPVTDYLGILNVTHLRLNNNGANEVLDRATNGDEVRVNIRFDEALTVEPTVKLGGNEYTAKYSEAMSGNSGKYYYSVDIKLEEEMDLTDGEEIPIEVYGYEDAAGNVGNTLNNEDINTKYEKVIYDITSPVRTSADFYVVGKHDETLIVEVSDNKKEQYQFAKNGDKIVMNAQFKEKLANIPTFVLIDSAGNRINLNEQGEVLDRGLDKNTHCYLYQASYKIAEDEANIAEGQMTIEISNIYDQVGLGEGYVITKPSNSRMIYYDRTNPELRVKNDEEDGKDNNGNSYTIGTEPNYSKISFKLHDNIAIKDIEINGEVVRTISDKIVTWSDANFDGFVKGYLSQGENTVVLRDWAGNEVKYTFNYDITAPARVYSTVRLDKEKEENPYIGEDKNKYYYVKNGDEFEFAMAFTEELKQAPTVTIAGREIQMTLNEKVKEEESKYLYEGTFAIPADETELSEGKLEIKVSNIVDFAGNEMEDTIQTPTSNGRIVVYDRTNPELIVKDDEDLTIGYEPNYSKISFKLHDNIAIKELEINGEVIRTFSDGIITWSDANFDEFVKAYLSQGENTVVLRDWAGNEVEYTFNYDNEAPRRSAFNLLVFNDNNNDKEFYAKVGDTIQTYISFNEKLAHNPTFYLIDENGEHLVDASLVTAEEPNKDGKYVYQVLYKVEADTELVDGEIKVRVTDLEDVYGNKIQDETEPSNGHKLYLDTKSPATGEKGFPLYVLTQRANEDTRPYTVIRDGEKLYVEANFDEKLAYNPQISLIRKDGTETDPVELPYIDKVYSKYRYYVTLTIDANDLQLENGNRINFKITNVEDKAGNISAFDNEDVTEIKLDDGREYGQVYYDNKAPEYKVLRVHNDTHYNNGGDLNVATNGDSIRFGVQFDEELAVEPTLVIEGNGPEEARTFKMIKSDIDLEYIADVKLTNEMELPQGEIKFKIYGYEDVAGNSISIDKALTEANINHTKYNGVKYDTIAPEYQTLGILNTTNMNENEDITVAKDGDNVRVLVWFKEKLAVEPKISILNKDGDYVELESGCKYSNDGRENVHYYIANFKLSPEMNLPQGEIKFKIYGFEDVAGNTVSEENALTNENINRTDYTKVIYDSISPDNFVYQVRIQNNTEGKVGDPSYAKVGDNVWVYVTFNEKLSVNPTMTIAGQKVITSLHDFGEREDGCWYTYIGTLQMTEEMEEGLIEFTISDYVDLAGNAGKDLDATTDGSSMTFDKTAPKGLSFEYDEKLTNRGVTVTLKTSEPITFVDSGTWNMEKTEQCIYTKWYTNNTTEKTKVVKFIDRAGNEGEIIIEVNNIDRVDPEVEISYSPEGATNEDVVATLKANEKVTIENSEGWTTEDGKIYTKTYKSNTIDKVIVKDVAGNDTEVTVTIDNIDRDGPVITLDTDDKIYLEVGDEFEVPMASAEDKVEGILYDNNLEFDQIDWYGNNGAEEFKFNKVDTNREGQYNIFYRCEDSLGNKSEKVIKVYIRDYSKVTYDEPIYETLDNGNVLVTINANKLIYAPSGWILSDNGKSISKEYTDNTDYLGERVKLEGVNGSSKNVIIKIDNINKNTINIGTEESLLQLAKDINNGTSFAGKTIKLTKNISLGGQQWTPIYAGNLNGNGSMLEGATIDGNGYAIKGLYSSRNPYTADGSIDAPYGNGFISDNIGNLTIKNIKFYDTTIIDPTSTVSNSNYSQHYVGTVIGHNQGNITVENVTVKNSHLENSWQCGGIIGYSSTGIAFKNCSIADSFIGGPNATAGTLFGLGIVNITVDNCKSYDVRLYTDSLTWESTAKKEGNFWVGHLYHDGYGGKPTNTKLTVTNSRETNVTVVDSIEK